MLNGRWARTCGLIAMGVLAACAKPPKMEMADAENALNAAEQAGAPEYAEADFAAAREAFSDAQAKIDAKDYKAARMAALLAKSMAEEAEAGVAMGKEAAKARATEVIASVESRLKSIKTDAAKMKGAAAKEVNAQIKKFEDAWTVVKEDLLKEQFARVARQGGEFISRIEALAVDVAENAKAAAKPASKKQK